MNTFDSISHWDQLHQQPRFRPLYPNDNVVRFLMASRSLLEQGPARFLDIGMGAGRHCKLAMELGFEAVGLDISLAGLQHARERLRQFDRPVTLLQGSMLALPFADSSIAAALSYGVFYYGTAQEMKQAIQELRRILSRGGRAFVVLRTTDDYRFAKGERLGPHTFRLNITDTNEYETVQHFLSAEDIPNYFSAFSEVSFEKTETTFANRTGVNSDWLITVEK